MFVGYAVNGPSDTYRMYVPKLSTIRETRNVQWMKRMLYQEKEAIQDMTVDSLELIFQNGKIKN